MQNTNQLDDKKSYEANSKIIVSWINKIVLFATAILMLIIGSYLYQFGTFSLSSSQEKWGQFGDYIGGTANPIFGFLTFISLIITIGIQNKQLNVSSRELELSRKELELTRQELARSASAQEASEKALKEQAKIASETSRLNTISFLLEKYSKEFQPYAGKQFSAESLHFREKLRLEERKSILEKMLEDVFNNLKLEEENNGS